jgi:hypothetical protein
VATASEVRSCFRDYLHVWQNPGLPTPDTHASNAWQVEEQGGLPWVTREKKVIASLQDEDVRN